MTKDNKAAKADPVAVTQQGQFAYDGLDRVIHERARLGLLTALISRPGGHVFGELRELCALTDGNLSRHLQTLQEAGLIEIWKGQRDNYPQTLVRLSELGRKKFSEYLSELQRVLELAAQHPQTSLESVVETARGLRPRPT
jgi:DNA-binding MarR family transcriptional regulator